MYVTVTSHDAHLLAAHSLAAQLPKLPKPPKLYLSFIPTGCVCVSVCDRITSIAQSCRSLTS